MPRHTIIGVKDIIGIIIDIASIITTIITIGAIAMNVKDAATIAGMKDATIAGVKNAVSDTTIIVVGVRYRTTAVKVNPKHPFFSLCVLRIWGG